MSRKSKSSKEIQKIKK